MSMDTWDGYTASRRRITQGWVDAGVRNAVVLTGDVHSAWANDVKLDFDRPDSATVGTELVCTSISSSGDGRDSDPSANSFLRANPHIKFFNDQRGYVLARVTSEELRADFMVVPYVTKPGAPAHVRATVVVEDGNPGARLTYQAPVRPRADAGDQVT
jgi:alkaline phosphatase D